MEETLFQSSDSFSIGHVNLIKQLLSMSAHRYDLPSSCKPTRPAPSQHVRTFAISRRRRHISDCNSHQSLRTRVSNELSRLNIAMEEYVRIPKHLIVDLLRAENGLSAALVNFPPTVRPVVNRCTAKIRQIAATAGLTTGECSSAHEQLAVSDSASQGMFLSFELVVKLKKNSTFIVYFNPALFFISN